MHPYLLPITKQFQQHADKTNAQGMRAYMLHQFDFFGIKTPLRRRLSNTHFKTFGITDIKDLETIVKEALEQPQREYQYFAIELFSFHRKLWKPSSIKLIQFCISHKSWWDSVDTIATEWVGPFFKLFPEKTIQITSGWNKSTDMWLQRSSILFQKAYKKDTNTALLAEYILHCRNSKEFFIRKVIGWALREYSKTDANWVKQFVANHELSSLSKKEALKRLK
ncbi:MAG: DNA alkylation repair protein [Bacteroidota bacterium]|nr:DNA alkylation repair protein [Bacteroidota bacterium]